MTLALILPACLSVIQVVLSCMLLFQLLVPFPFIFLIINFVHHYEANNYLDQCSGFFQSLISVYFQAAQFIIVMFLVDDLVLNSMTEK